LRRGIELGALLVAVVVGYAIASVLGAPALVEPSDNPEPGERQVAESSTTTTHSGVTATTPSLAESYLVWSTGGLTPELVDGLQAHFDALSVVAGDVAELNTDDEWVIPLDALAIDPETHQTFDPQGHLEPLLPGTVVLGETSARFRELEVGDELSIGGTVYEVVTIVPDEVVAAAEVVFSRADPTNPIVTDRFALVSSDLARHEFEDLVRDMYDGPAPLRIRSRGETPWLRHGDAVLPQIFIKAALGEFAYRGRAGSEFTQDPDWIADNIVTDDVPVLGRVTCHRTIVEMLAGAMHQLVEEGLAHLIDPAGYAGCWNPRYIQPTTGRPAGISRHAWGAAVDVNAATNQLGSAGNQDPRLVEVMSEWGFTWGGDWLVPDPMHFEYGIGPP
jgi:hypothetical protein